MKHQRLNSLEQCAMSDRKRDAKQVVSPQKVRLEKKRKDVNQKENEAPFPRLKTKYVFAPANNLNCSTPLKRIKVDPNIPRRENETPVPKEPREIIRNDHHSSDDHVFWAATPKQTKHGNTTQKNLPSSPLTTEQLKIDTVNSVTNKYQSMMYDNFASQRSPTALKTNPNPTSTTTTSNPLIPKSDSFPKCNGTKSLTGQKSKLIGSKSFTNSPATPLQGNIKRKDITSLISTIESGFDLTTESHEDVSALKEQLTQEMKKVEEFEIHKSSKQEIRQNNPVKQDKSFDVSSDFFSDDFSDDFMNDLDKVLDKNPSQALSGEVKAINNVLEEASDEKPIQHPLVKDNDFDDTIEEDDLDDDEFDKMIEEKLTQKPSTTQPSTDPRLTTQEEHIRKMDSVGSKIFKQDIERTDTFKTEYVKKGEQNLAKSAVERKDVKRFQVKQVLCTSYMQNNFKRDQKIITAVDGDGNISKIVVRDPWVKLEIGPRDIIHIIGSNHKLVDKDSDNLLIWNPDLLLSATLIGDTVNCYRRSVLKTRLDFRGEYNVALIVGEIVHSLFQAVLRERKCSNEFMQEELEHELDDNLLTILVIDETKESIRNEVSNHLPYIKTWLETYAADTPTRGSSIRISGKREKSLFSASNILDIEENIWSPIYGLRGLIDVTIEANLQSSAKRGKFIAPLELKSGNRAQLAHGAQASLYTLLLKDRYDMDVGFFMLVYTRLKETTKFEIDTRQLKDLVMCRNLLSNYLREGSRALPEIKKSSECDSCYAVSECMTYNKLMEDGTAAESGLKENVYEDLTGHLDEKHRLFFNYWDDLITKEEGSINILKRDLFLTDGPTREKTSGKCLSNLIIKGATDKEGDENKAYIYTFERKTKGDVALNVSQLSKHDRILVSDEAGHFALCSGFVISVRPTEITISTNRRLKNNNVKLENFDVRNNQTYQTVLRPMEGSGTSNNDVTYRIDKDEMFHGMKLARFNLLNLFLKDGDSHTRELIVEGRSPVFKSKLTHYELPENHSFNVDQIQAFDKVLSAEDYTLLLGMPGTGKTTVIAQLIRLLVSQNKTVLLTSYTHSAVDNILLKIKNDDIGIVRLGSVSRIHPEVREFSPYQRDIKSKADLDKAFLEPPIVATTCLGISDWIFNKRRFDYCIVDESSQVSMPVCLGPLGFCDKFVLVGDHYQLPPLIVNPDAKFGLSKSLFKALSESHPESVVDLTHQYRMCSDIMLLSNTIIYEGRLKCGSKEVADQSLKVPQKDKIFEVLAQDVPVNQRWMDIILEEKNKVIFLNHDRVGDCEETSSKENIENPKEADLVYQIVQAMLLCGVDQSSVGVMSFYRAQLRLFYRKFSENKDIEMLTADQFQGRDKDCVIISLVKSNKRNDAGSLLKEWRRINVAITRARSKLIIIGSKRTLQSLQTIDAFMNILHSRGWFYDLPKDADTFYKFNTPKIDPTNPSSSKKPSQIKTMGQSKALQNKPLTKDIAIEMGL